MSDGAGIAARSALTWAWVVTWTVALGALVTVLSVLTLGRARRWLATTFAPIWARPLLAVAGIRLHVHGAEHLAGRHPRVLTLNHASDLDPVLTCALAPPGICPLVKREMAYIPVVGQVFWLLGGQFVDRGDPNRASAQLDALGRAIRTEGLTAVIAPEGTRSRDGRLGRFRPGAARVAAATGAPVLPMVLHGAGSLMAARGWHIRPGDVHVVFHPPRPVPADADPVAVSAALEADYRAWLDEGPPA